jgi:sigma-B regulation protein RsbU (phosphoserine phosphatase)
MVHSFCVGLILAYLFIKYDILTTIIAGSVSIMITTGLSLFYLNHTSYFFNGAIVLIILIAPLVIAVIGFIKKEKFKYQGDDLPPHIRRISDRARMARELEIARKVQLSLLPRESPKLQGLEIFSTCIPAREVGGDYYDFVRLSDSKIGIAIGDVSGKGVPAAIYMTLTKGILQSYAEENISPKKVLSKVNKLMYKTIEHDSFVSMFYAILDIKKKVITYSRAGHNPAILFKNFNKSFKLLEPKGIGLGLEQGKLFDQTLIEEHLSLEIGDLLVFYTDGFTEAMDSFQNEYGEEKLLNIIENNSDITASNLVNKILHDVKRFVKGYPQHDDMTIVAVKVT